MSLLLVTARQVSWLNAVLWLLALGQTCPNVLVALEAWRLYEWTGLAQGCVIGFAEINGPD
jgi:hypothetical protein